MRRSILSLSLALIFAAVPTLDAQTVWIQVGATNPGEYAEPEAGVRVGTGGSQMLGFDASLDTYLRYLVIPAFVGVLDLSLRAQLRPVQPVTLVGRAGGTGLLLAAGGGALLFTGYQGGVGVAVTADARTTVRLDYTYRRVRLDGRYQALPSVTFGFMVHHTG
ncbi:MAG TPA: hypothetical protein VKO86_14905 [Gemmatimonadales bacterium]|nr:hypothetical protein [Gemmatimonadales bacterium]